MPPPYRPLVASLWLAWAAYWWLSAHGVKRAARRESVASRLAHLGPLALAVLLLVAPRASTGALGARFVPVAAPWLPALATLLTALGLAFAVWARRHLGANWSASVTIKEGHDLVTSGPYALVRHPIYSGLLLALAGTALGVGEWRALLAFAIACLALARKLRLEERWMRERFGARYAAYSERVPALIPRIA
jgi:protein-S-isoprenylcysteine O-methyltransferase Ste14